MNYIFKTMNQHAITLFCALPTASLLFLLTPTQCAVLPHHEKSVISYRIGSKPSICEGFSRYAFSEKAYRRYTFDAHDAGSNPIEQVASTRNMEV